MFKKQRGLASLLAIGLASVAGPACADAVTDWNEITMSAVAVGRPGPIGQLDTALVQIAVHDAVQAIEHRFEPYHAEIKGATGSASAAAASAAHAVLVGMYPAQAANLDATYHNYVASQGLTGDPGLAVGEQAAARILPLRRLNPDPLPPPYMGGVGPGLWRPTESYLPGAPASFSPMFAPYIATFDPFTLTAPTRFRADPPPALNSEQYAKDYEEVKAMGAQNSTLRTPAQTDLGYFFTDNIFAMWNRAMRGVAAQHITKIGDSARLFALANVAAADALISCWDTKKHYAFWRPVTAIQEGELDGNPTTIGDPSWRPLINTPNYPDYTSGVNNITAAMTRTLALFFDTDRVTFDVTTNAPAAVQKTRTYKRFSDAARDAVDARVYVGIHFRFADTAARDQGNRVADWVFKRFLLPIK